MKKLILLLCVSLYSFAMFAATAPESEILFEKTSHNFGKVSEDNPILSCKFIFKNIGDAPLIIEQVIASCGCTDPRFTEKPIKPGEKGEISVTYNGKGRYVGPFSKTITVKSNAKTKFVRLRIQGDMEASKKEK